MSEHIEVSVAVADRWFEPALERFRRLGFAVRMISPADDPALALLEGDGMTVRLIVGDAEWPGDLPVPTLMPAFEVSRLTDAGWVVGRAGMLYRDLLPNRQGGRFIASHIRISNAGPVPDEVHYHNIQFQLIFCVAGWVRLIYQGQGEPFVLIAGDVLHRAAEASWTPWRTAGLECRETGVGAATGDVVDARVVRATAGAESSSGTHDGELQFWFVLSGVAILLRTDQPPARLEPGDSVAVPAGMAHGLRVDDPGCEILEVTVPARSASRQ